MHVLGYDSALSIYRMAGNRLSALGIEQISLSKASGNIRGLPTHRWRSWTRKQGCIHLIVGSRDQRRHGAHYETHNWGTAHDSWPAVPLGDGMYLSSPEFLYLQMANVLDDLELALLGCELCGLYGYRGEELTRRASLTTRAAIGTFLKTRQGARGIERARRVLPLLVERSRSPMETVLALRLSLPRKRGGFGISQPLLNHPISLGASLAGSRGVVELSPDLSWPEHKLAVEYDSDLHHSDGASIVRDSRRRFALEELGYTVITVTSGQMRSFQEFDAIARRIARITGKRLRDEREAEKARRIALGRRLHALACNRALMTIEGKRGSDALAA